MQRLSDDVQRELRRLGPQAELVELAARWPALVGDQVARNAWPARLGRDGTLHVATSSSAWAFELTGMQAVVLERVRGALGGALPKRLAFSPGRLPEPARESSPTAAKEPTAPTARQLRRAAELTASSSNAELRSRIAKALAASLARAS